MGDDGDRVTAAGTLRPRQAAVVVVIGVVLWFLAANALRLSPAAWWGGGWPTVALFASGPVLGWGTVRAVQRLAALAPAQLVAGAALGSAAAMLCDGVALTWSPLYGVGRDLGPVAAWLLWVVALTTVAAFAMAHRGVGTPLTRSDRAPVPGV